ncbi:DUF1934 domain-containing protein [Enterococcus timonensis]|uniref:DUF1934 domain-containing protein n=1 Tax=Enterococcus timonensis TaxID=1852364 RepID=UPI0008D8EE49|nr:DUF1934 domain-containing protein [Enterococcus timonensis]
MDLKNGQAIQLHLETKVQQKEENSDFVFDGKGQLVKIGDTLYIRYSELQSDELTEIPVTIKIEPDGIVQIMRGKELHSRLKFSYQKKIPMTYRTPFGLFTIESFTKYLHFSLKDRPTSGILTLDYDLFLQDELMGSYQMKLNFTA